MAGPGGFGVGVPQGFQQNPGVDPYTGGFGGPQAPGAPFALPQSFAPGGGIDPRSMAARLALLAQMQGGQQQQAFGLPPTPDQQQRPLNPSEFSAPGFSPTQTVPTTTKKPVGVSNAVKRRPVTGSVGTPSAPQTSNARRVIGGSLGPNNRGGLTLGTGTNSAGALGGSQGTVVPSQRKRFSTVFSGG